MVQERVRMKNALENILNTDRPLWAMQAELQAVTDGSRYAWQYLQGQKGGWKGRKDGRREEQGG